MMTPKASVWVRKQTTSFSPHRWGSSRSKACATMRVCGMGSGEAWFYSGPAGDALQRHHPCLGADHVKASGSGQASSTSRARLHPTRIRWAGASNSCKLKPSRPRSLPRARISLMPGRRTAASDVPSLGYITLLSCPDVSRRCKSRESGAPAVASPRGCRPDHGAPKGQCR